MLHAAASQCLDFLCDYCLHRPTWPERRLAATRATSPSPTLTWRPGAPIPPTVINLDLVCDVDAPMPTVGSGPPPARESDMELDVHVPDEGDRSDVKRAARGGRNITPTKIARQDDDEPTNKDVLGFLQQMQVDQALALRGAPTRLGRARVRMVAWEEATAMRFDLPENVDNIELTRARMRRGGRALRSWRRRWRNRWATSRRGPRRRKGRPHLLRERRAPRAGVEAHR